MVAVAAAMHARAGAIVVRLAFVEWRLAPEGHVGRSKWLVSRARIVGRTLGVAPAGGVQALADLRATEADLFWPALGVAHAAVAALTKLAKSVG